MGNGAARKDLACCNKPCGARCSGQRLGNTFIKGFGVMAQTAEKDALRGKINRPQLGMGLDVEPVIIYGDLEVLS